MGGLFATVDTDFNDVAWAFLSSMTFNYTENVPTVV